MRSKPDLEPSRARALDYLWIVAFVALATGVGALVRDHLAAADFVMLYLLVIGVAAALFGRGPSLIASVLSVLAYDFFVHPVFTFDVHDERHLLTFAMMFAVGFVISGLMLRIRRQEREARDREGRTAALYALSRDLGAALDEDQVARVIAEHASETFQGGAAVLLPDDGALRVKAASSADVALDTQELAAAQQAFDSGQLAGLGTQVASDARMICVPLQSGLGPETLGVLAFAPAALGVEQRHFLDVFARQAALAMQRARLAESAKAAALRARTEEMRSSLLSAVSHDLRTPLAAITGAATTLRDANGALNPRERAELLDAVCEEADRLERLVRNLLDMTRLESGAAPVKREWVPLEEVVGSALTRLDSQLAGRPIRADPPYDLPLLSVDPVLLEQVFVNLLENAGKYTPAGSPIEISARAVDGAVVVEVADRGPGLPAGSELRIFEKFARGPHAGEHGVGLGLAICRGIMEAHGGALDAQNRAGGGAVFRLTLPLIGEAPPVPPEEDRS